MYIHQSILSSLFVDLTLAVVYPRKTAAYTPYYLLFLSHLIPHHHLSLQIFNLILNMAFGCLFTSEFNPIIIIIIAIKSIACFTLEVRIVEMLLRFCSFRLIGFHVDYSYLSCYKCAILIK